jgi:predicted RNA-binding protein with PIN domain
MITYLIDGNNLIGKIAFLAKIGKKDKQATREKLVFMLDNYFEKTKNKAVVHFDGFPGEAIKSNKVKIVYSEKKTADETIKRSIEMTDNPRNIVVITSDFNLSQFSRVCGSKVCTSEEFSKKLCEKDRAESEEKKINSISKEEIRKMFGV